MARTPLDPRSERGQRAAEVLTEAVAGLMLAVYQRRAERAKTQPREQQAA